jgi:dipeptidyl aminopeptidase/acylaminoacyl peptidase
VWRVGRRGGSVEQVFNHAPGEAQGFADAQSGPRYPGRVGVESYEWSPDGSRIAFTTTPATDAAATQRLINDGLLYDPSRMFLFNILRKQWSREPTELWVYSVQSRRERRIWRIPQAGAISWAVGLSGFVWSPDGKRIAVSYAAGISQSGGGYFNDDLGIVDVAGRTFLPLIATDSLNEWHPEWSPDGSHIAFLSWFDGFLNSSGSRSALGVVNIATRETQYVARGVAAASARLWWAAHGTAVMFQTTNPAGMHRARSGLYQVELASGRVQRFGSPDDHISDCGNVVHDQVACVRQGPNVPPDPAILDLRNGSVRVLATTNPQLRDAILGPVTELHWSNRFGVETNGFLIRPYNYVAGERYPLLLVLYGFQGRFIAGAEWLTSYPGQIFAREGFAVLLSNYPRTDGWEGNDFQRGSVAAGYGPLASLESAVTLLGEQGLVDTTRVGIMGFSYGGFLAQFALTHSSKFHVAAIGDVTDFNPGSYWLWGDRSHTLVYEKVLAGPPSGPTLANWLSFSPAFNADRVRAPVLMEYNSDEALFGLEMSTALRRHGVPVEFVIYPDDGHVFMQPVHRLSSMRRNLQWFSFWLLGKESASRDQIDRWRAMRGQLARLEKPLPSGDSLRTDSP